MIILTRTLRMAAEGDDVDVEVRVFLPRSEEDCWCCEYEIGWPNAVRRHKAFGVDAIQSLLIALKMIGVEIYISSAHRSGKLRWDVQGQGYGFPPYAGIRDLYEGDDRML